MTIKEDLIRKYITNMDFDDKWGMSKIKEDMKSFLGEEPGVDITYKKDLSINEVTGESFEITNIDSLHIIFYDTDNKFKKLEFKIGA